MITKYRFGVTFRKYLLPVMFGIIIIGLVVYSVVLHTEKEEMELKLSGLYQQSFQELMLDMRGLETELAKLEASNDTYQSTMILMDVWRQTGDTESSIAQLPISYNSASPFIQFINRTGDYCRYLSKKVSDGQEIVADDLKQIKQIRQSCTEISAVLDTAWKTGYLPSIDTNSSDFISTASTSTSGNLDFSNEKYPRLIYDGPYSESIEGKTPEALEGQDVTAEQAKQKAVEFLGEENVLEISAGQADGGKIESFDFDGKMKDGNEFYINITKQGGHVLWFMRQTNGRGNAVPTDEKYEQLAKIATDYLTDKGIENTHATYAQFYGGNAIINMVPVQNEVVLYPDLIKIWIDIEQNKVVGMDSLNYVMSHKERKLKQTELTKEQAATKVTSRLKIESIEQALIPTETKDELLCWEFVGKIENQDYIVYINCESGKTEDIFLIKHTNEGTLVQ